MEILQREHDRPLRTELLEHEEDLLEQPQPRVRPVRVAFRAPRVGQLRDEPGQLPQLAREGGELGRVADRPQSLDEGKVGEPHAHELDAPALEDGRSAAPRPLAELGDEPRLADPGAAADQHRAPVASARRVEQRLELRELVEAPDEALRCRGGGRAPRADGRLPHRALGAGLERRILVEDPVLQPLERRRRLDPELAVERAPEPLVGLERLSLPPGAVQRHDQLPVEPLAERMLRRECLELSDHVAVAPRREIRLDPVLEARQAQLLEVRALDPGERLRELGQSRAAPQLERVPEQRGRRRRVAGLERRSALDPHPAEAAEVERVGLELDDVPGSLRAQHARRKRLAEVRDVDLHHLGRGLRHVLSPEVVDEPLDRHGPVRVEQQPGEERTRLAAAEREPRGAVNCLERA